MPNTVRVALGDQLVNFICEDPQAELQLGLLFKSWPQEPPWLGGENAQRLHQQPIHFRVEVDGALGAAPPGSHLIFADQASTIPGQSTLISVYESDRLLLLRFDNDATVRLPIAADPTAEQILVESRISRRALYSGRLEDIVFCSLAPLLRRRGFFMVHAFAAVKGGRALLLVGESGSGKTTTGLSLLSHAWDYLANDVVLLSEREGVALVWPTPGCISLTQDTLTLVPDLRQHLEFEEMGASKHSFPAIALVKGWAPPAPAALICFPQLTASAAIDLRPSAQSVTLARLMEGSVDRWDKACLDSHIKLLELLSRQTRAFDMHLTRDLDQLPLALDQVWRSGSRDSGEALPSC